MLQIRVGNIFSDIIGSLSDSQYVKLRRNMSFRPEGFQFSTMYNRWIKDKNGKRVRRMWDGWRRQIWKKRGGKYYFPTGLFSVVRSFFEENNIEYKAINCRIKPNPVLNLSLNREVIEDRDYQKIIIDNACASQRGVISLATGGGKSIISGGIIAKLNVSPFIVFVTSIDLLDQAKESLEMTLLQDGKPIRVGQIGGGTIDIRDINVMTIQTAVRAMGKKWNSKYKFDSDDSEDKTPIEKRRDDIIKLIRTSSGAICDEVQHWRAETCQLVARSLHNAYYTYGCSATPYRDEGDDLLIQACFGKKIAEINASYLIRNNWLIRPSIKIVHVKGPQSPFHQWQQLYKDQVSENKSYNQMITSICNSYIHNKRLVLVLVQHIAHGKKLASQIPGSVFLSGKSSRKKRQENIQKLRNKEVSCIVSTVIFDEGIDVRPLDTLILAGQGKSKVRAMQRIGRILRLCPETNKSVATAIDFRIHQKYLLKHSLARENMYKTEPEYDIEEIDP